MQKKLYVNSALGKTSPLRGVQPGQNHPTQTPVSRSDDVKALPARWTSIYVDIPDYYVLDHPEWSFEKICHTFREKLFKAYRKAHIRFSAITVSSITPLEERHPFAVNRQYGLKLRLAGVLRPESWAKFKAILNSQCHEIHKRAEAHDGVTRSWPMPKRMYDPRWGSAIVFSRSTKEWESVRRLIQANDRNVRDYRQHAMERGLDLDRAGMSMIHGTMLMQSEVRELKQRKSKVLRKLQKNGSKKTNLIKCGAESDLQPVMTVIENSSIDARAPVESVERQQTKSGYQNRLLRQMTSYGLQIGSKYYPAVQRLRAIIWPY